MKRARPNYTKDERKHKKNRERERERKMSIFCGIFQMDHLLMDLSAEFNLLDASISVCECVLQ